MLCCPGEQRWTAGCDALALPAAAATEIWSSDRARYPLSSAGECVVTGNEEHPVRMRELSPSQRPACSRQLLPDFENLCLALECI